MRWGLIARIVLLALVVALVTWIARNTYWADATVPMPLKGEAARNPFYAAQRFAEALGAYTQWDRALPSPPSRAVIVVSTWNWTLSTHRRLTMEQWVESGGRLVVDSSLIGGDGQFRRWSGISRNYPEYDEDVDEESDRPVARGTRVSPRPCRTLDEAGDRPLAAGERTHRITVCGFSGASSLTSVRAASWELRDESGAQVLRVPVGRGTVTVINATPFGYRDLFDDENALLFVAATRLRAGDEFHFLSEGDPEPLLAMAWRLGAPVVAILGVLMAFALWRSGARFGPRVAATDGARRSLAEQIRGTGQFVMRFGGGQSLHAAAVRALGEAAARHISAYDRLPALERIAQLARVTGLDEEELAAAINHSGARRSNELRSAIALLEAARRRILVENKGSKHGNRIEHDYARR